VVVLEARDRVGGLIHWGHGDVDKMMSG
jgi:hypothetical protein